MKSKQFALTKGVDDWATRLSEAVVGLAIRDYQSVVARLHIKQDTVRRAELENFFLRGGYEFYTCGGDGRVAVMKIWKEHILQGLGQYWDGRWISIKKLHQIYSTVPVETFKELLKGAPHHLYRGNQYYRTDIAAGLIAAAIVKEVEDREAEGMLERGTEI